MSPPATSPIAGVSAVICTRNRRTYLEKALNSLLRQSAAPGSYEIIVVDNGSTDDTAQYLETVATGSNQITVFRESKIGPSRARNKALSHVRHEFVAFLDDDAIAREDWIERIRGAFENPCEPFAVLGGKTEPIWEVQRPRWLSAQGLGALAIVDWSSEPCFLSEGQFIVGANMAFRTTLLAEAGGFPEKLGRMGELLSGEEIFVANGFVERGYRTYYDPGVVAFHHVQRERVNRKWLIRSAYWQGVSNAIIRELKTPLHRGVVAAMVTGRILWVSVRWFWFFVKGDSATQLDEHMSLARNAGDLAVQLGLSVHKSG